MATRAERALPLIPIGKTSIFNEMEFRSSVIRTAINRLELIGYKFDCATKGCIGYRLEDGRNEYRFFNQIRSIKI